MREAGKRCGFKYGAAALLKKRIAADLLAFFGEDVIRNLLDGVKPKWESDLRTALGGHLGLAEAIQNPMTRPETHSALPRNSMQRVPGK